MPSGTAGAGGNVNLSLTKTDSADPVEPGAPFTYTLTVTNVGTTLASDLVIVDVIPAGLEILETSTTGRDCTLSPGELRCYVDTLEPGAIATVTLAVTATGPGAHHQYRLSHVERPRAHSRRQRRQRADHGRHGSGVLRTVFLRTVPVTRPGPAR